MYDLLINEVNEMSTAHSVMAAKIVEEVEKPLRSRMANDPDYSRIRGVSIMAFEEGSRLSMAEFMLSSPV